MDKSGTDRYRHDEQSKKLGQGQQRGTHMVLIPGSNLCLEDERLDLGGVIAIGPDGVLAEQSKEVLGVEEGS